MMYNNVNNGHELSKDIKEKVYEVKTFVTGEQIENIIVTALEGGIDYWGFLENDKPEWNDKPEGLPVSQYATQLILEGKSLSFTDIGDDDPGCDVWELTLEKLLKGIGQNMKERPHDVNLDDMDATTAECIIQYALFDEIVYG